MKLTAYSINRLTESAHQWQVDHDYYDPLFNYLVHGFHPGGFWTSVLANDFMSALQRSHPGNQIPALKRASGWIQDRFPAISYGSYKLVDDWTRFTDLQRRSHLEACDLIYTEREEVELALRGVNATVKELLY
jgi:hypothetical protein